MNTTLHPTEEFFIMRFNGVPVPTRVWLGTSPLGIPITAFVVAVIPTNEGDVDKLMSELPPFMVRTNTFLALQPDGQGFLITGDPTQPK